MIHLLNLAILAFLSIMLSNIAVTQKLPVLSGFLTVQISIIPLFFYFSADKKDIKKADLCAQLMCFLLYFLSFFLPGILAGTTLLAYELSDWRKNWPLLFIFVPLIYLHVSPLHVAILFCLIFLAISLAHWTSRAREMESSHYSYVDRSSELLRRQRQLNRQLIAQRELDRSSDILAERNRIARSIHDNVGHKLTSSILQLTALELMYKAEEDSAKTAQINDLKESLTEAMDLIRESIHDIHSESLSIENALEQLAQEFKFCPVNLIVQISDMPSPSLHYTIMAICREALNNTAKHSNATRVDISLKQWGDYYQLLIVDNGQNPPETLQAESDGLGLISMEERATALGGTLNYNKQKHGFRIFARLPLKQDDSH